MDHWRIDLKLCLSSRWNIVDQIFFTIENIIKSVHEGICDAASGEPDVELIIEAETKYLQRENERLKKRDIPVYLIEEENKVICPKCQTQQQSIDVKYCCNCGHRVTRRINKEFGKGA